MIKYRYQQLRNSTKLLTALGILLIATIIAWQFHYDVLFAVIATASVLAVVHVALTFWKSTLSALIILLQLAIYFTLGDGITLYLGGYSEEANFSIAVIRILLLTLSIVQAALFGYIAYRFSKGKMWLNLFVSFSLFNIVGFSIFLFHNNLLVVALIAAFFTAIGYLALRSIRRKNSEKAPEKPKLAQSLRSNIETQLSEMKLEFTDVSKAADWEATHYLAHDEHALYNIRVVPAKESLVINSKGLQTNGVSLNPDLEYLRLDAIDNAKTVGTKQMISVLLFPAESMLPQGTKTVNISRRKQPSYSLGVSVIATPKRLKKFVIAQRQTKKLPEKVLKKLDF